jgi:glutathione S-transferase
MKLYFSPGACSMAPHIALREAGLAFELEKVDLRARRTAGGDDYTKINPKGYVPALRLDDGAVLTEVGVLLQYVADHGSGGLAPPFGTMERYRLMEWLNFVSTEVHKQFSPLFNPQITPEWKENQLKRLAGRFDFLAQHLEARPYLMGDAFSVADAYLFTVLRWTKLFNVDLSKWPKLQEYIARIGARPSVQATLKAEGIGK